MFKNNYGVNHHRTLICLAFLVVALCCAANPALAAEEGWQPPPPEPVAFDWVQLVSGEWLKGEIKSFEDDVLEFKSDKLGDQSLSWDDVAQVRSMRVVQVLLADDRSYVGRIIVADGAVQVLGDQGQEFERADLVRFIVGEPKEINFWSSTINLGANFRKGNTDAVDINTQIKVQRRSIKNRLIFDYIGNYNELEGVESGDNQRLAVTWHRFLTARLFLMPVFGEYYRDPFQNIAFRGSIGTGVGYTLVDTAKVDWDVSGGPAYLRTDYDEVEEGTSDSESTAAFVGNTVLTVELVKWLDFNYDYRFQIVNEENGTYNHHMEAGFNTDLTGPLSLNTSIVWDRIQDPRANADGDVPEQDDFKLIVGLAFDF